MEDDASRLSGSSVILMERYRGGDELAAEALFDRYFARLTGFARSRLSARRAPRIDPEDIVMSVYRSFFLKARAGRFTLGRGGDLWRLLASITKHKLLRKARHHRADCRSVDIELPLETGGSRALSVRSPDRGPDAAITENDELEWVLGQCDPFTRRAVELRLQGAELVETARETGRSERTVRRAFVEIRKLVAARMAHDGELQHWKDPDAKRQNPQRTRRRSDTRHKVSNQFPDDVNSQLDTPVLSHRDVLLQRMIGAGRMGKVYQGELTSNGRTVAVKFLRKSLLREAWLVERFINEPRTIGKLNHPLIVGTHGLGRTPGGSYFIVMDLVPGPNLDQIVKTRLISISETVRWSIQLCEAIEHAHAHGIVHCDLKPANLLLDEESHLRVTDFGLARSLTEHNPGTADIEGTAPFMAPEQVSRTCGNIGVPTDVYGIGAVLYTLLTGRPPWIGRTVTATLAAVVSPTPLVAPTEFRAEIPAPLNGLCVACLSKSQERRYPSVRDVRVALTGLAGQS